ncbi:MAG: hypothetical protein QM723_05245 [Myxococcaceae bacterium]
MTIDESRAVLFAVADASSGQERRPQLEAAARDFAKACQAASSGSTAAEHQAKRDEKRGVRLCPSCVTLIMPARGADGGPMQWIDAKTHRPHRCGR